MSATQETIQAILADFRLAMNDYPEGFKSRHWDKFPPDWEARLSDPAVWENFRNNGLTDGLETRWGHPVKRDGQSGYARDPMRARTVQAYDDLCGMFGADAVHPLLEAEVGNPDCLEKDGLKLNLVDLRLCWDALMIRTQSTLDPDAPVRLCEIGGGFGGLMGKLLKLYPNASAVVLDLPEVNAVQRHYLGSLFPDRPLRGLADGASDDARRDREIAVLPGWRVGGLADESVDLFVNTRSMQEMNRATVDGYLAHVNRCAAGGGWFYCVNRYWKATVGEAIRIKDFPFGPDWTVPVSQPAWTQPWIHALLLHKGEIAGAPAVTDVVRQLPPVAWSDVMTGRTPRGAALIKLVWGGHQNIDPGLRGWIRSAVRAGIRTAHRAIRG